MRHGAGTIPPDEAGCRRPQYLGKGFGGPARVSAAPGGGRRRLRLGALPQFLTRGEGEVASGKRIAHSSASSENQLRLRQGKPSAPPLIVVGAAIHAGVAAGGAHGRSAAELCRRAPRGCARLPAAVWRFAVASSVGCGLRDLLASTLLGTERRSGQRRRGGCCLTTARAVVFGQAIGPQRLTKVSRET